MATLTGWAPVAVSAAPVTFSVGSLESTSCPPPTETTMVAAGIPGPSICWPAPKRPAVVWRLVTVFEPAVTATPVAVSLAGSESTSGLPRSAIDRRVDRDPRPFDPLAGDELAGFGHQAGGFGRAFGEIGGAGRRREVARAADLDGHRGAGTVVAPLKPVASYWARVTYWAAVVEARPRGSTRALTVASVSLVAAASVDERLAEGFERFGAPASRSARLRSRPPGGSGRRFRRRGPRVRRSLPRSPSR